MSVPRPPAADPATAVLFGQLVAWLQARPEYPTAVKAAALGNVIAILFAKEAPTEPEAFAMVDEWARAMKWQIHDRRTGVEHP